jgi:hypothetical protein
VELKSFILRIAREGGIADGQEVAPAELTQQLSADNDGWYRYEATLQQDVTITPELLSLHDLTNEELQKCNIRVIPDRAPVARVISPTAEMAARPDEVVEVKFEAHDDHAIAKAELVVYEESSIDGDPPAILGVEDVPLGDQENAAHVLATAKLDLSNYDLRDGASISYAIRVSDNRVAMLGNNPKQRQTTTLRGRDSDADSSNDGSNARAVAKPTNASNYRGENTSLERGTSKSDREPSSERPTQDGSPQADSPRNGSGLAVTPVASTDPSGEMNAASSSDARRTNEPQQTNPEQSATARGRHQASDSPASSGPVNGSSSAESPPVPSGAAKEPLLTPSDKPASKMEVTPGNQSEVAGAGTARNAVANDTERDADTKSNGESPGADPRPQSTAAAANQLESREATPGSSADAAVRSNDGQSRGDNENLISGDLTTIDRRPNMTDDLPGQLSESNRVRLKIAEKIISASVAETDRATIQMEIRQRLEQIDHELKPAEQVLSSLVATVSQSGIADPQIQDLNGVDQRLARVDKIIADLRNESKETAYAFVGLHMVDIGTADIAPARDRVFSLIRQPDVETQVNVAEAMHRVSRARELLAELLIRYERVLREERLAETIEQTAKIYEVYVENLHRFLRAQTKPNPNPLERKMAIVEVDQEYLDRLREVTEMRRDLMAEFARMLADDPRLLSKYMDVIKRRQTSLRDRLTELHEGQNVIATELSGWLRVDETQRDAVWMLAAEVRLQDVAPLAQEASQLEERIRSQFPLALDPKHRNSSAVADNAKQTAVRARTAAAKARRLLHDPSDGSVELGSDIDEMAFWLAELDAAIERLAFENTNEETTDYANKRLAEGRTLFERVAGWTEIADHLRARRFSGLAKVDQRRIAFQTELLRIDMESIDQQLNAQFRGGVPQQVTALANELKQLMETITFNQAAATFQLESERLADAESQQAFALEGFKQAEELFDRIRRTVVDELDQIDPENPNIADLEDPTLDQLLEQLEREPDLNALLGLPVRPQNLRVISDFFASNDGDLRVPSALAQAAEQARARAEAEEQAARRMRRQSDEDDDMTEEEWRQVADAEEAQERLQEKIEELRQRAARPMTEPEEAERLRQMAAQLDQMRQQLAGRQIDKQQWEQMSRSDQMQAVLRAAARGEPLPDSQWNRLMSSLDDGLWQVRRRTPPEDYRRAIEQYQERLRRLTNPERSDVGL